MKKQSEVKIPLHILIDAIEMANDEWNQYLDIEEMQVVSLPEYPFAGEYDEEDQELSERIEEEEEEEEECPLFQTAFPI